MPEIKLLKQLSYLLNEDTNNSKKFIVKVCSNEDLIDLGARNR